jgi:hypothetical protein
MRLTDSDGVERLAALTFDLDTLARDLYRPALSTGDARRLEDVSFERVIPRIAEWLGRIGVRATFFTIGEYARRYPSVVRQLASAGHEIASHTQHHPRNFSMLGPAEVARDLKTAHETLATTSGVAPSGFRAPGFTTSAAMIETLIDLGYTYDSSIVPSWTYTTLKHVYRIAGLASEGYLYPESYRAVLAPQAPYRVSPTRRFSRADGASLLEIPISTGSVFQWPLIYGLHARAHSRVRQWIERAALARSCVLMVFHDLEFATEEDLNGLPVGTLTGPHIRMTIDQRWRAIEQWIDRARRTHRFTTLREVASVYLPECASIVR